MPLRVTSQRVNSVTFKLLGVGAVLILLAGCAGPGSGTPGPTATSTFASGFNTAKYEIVNASAVDAGTLRIGMSTWCGPIIGERVTPYHLAQNGVCRNLQRLVVRGLTAFAPYPGASGMQVLPDLAKELGAVSADGLTVTYELRDGVTWQDGSPITGEDVRLGLAQFDRDEKGVDFTSVTADGSTITITLRTPTPTLDEYLAMSAAAPIAANGEALASGPFVLESANRAGYALVRNAAWNQASDEIRTPHANRVEVTVGQDASALENKALSGALDVVIEPGASAVESERLLGNPLTAGDVDNPATGEVTMLAMQSAQTPVNDVACRRAVFSAVNRNEIVSTTGGSLVRMPAITVSPPNYPSYSGGYEPYPIGEGDGDIAAAKVQLAKCGNPDGFELAIAYPTSMSAVFNSLRLSLRRAGITVIGIPFADASFSSDVLGSPGAIDAAGAGAVLFSYKSPIPSVHSFLAPLVSPVTEMQNTNIAQLELRNIDLLVNSAELGSNDLAIQADVGRAIDRLILDTASYIPLTYAKQVLHRKRELTNVAINSALGTTYNIVEMGTQGSPATSSAAK